MDTTPPYPLCPVSRDWSTVSTLEIVGIFDSTFSATASVLPNEDVTAAAREYSAYLHAEVAVSLVAVNDRWSVYLVACDVFGAWWLAVRTYLATTLDLNTVSRNEAEALAIPGLAVIGQFPFPPRGWGG